jgi:hypothetical protein
MAIAIQTNGITRYALHYERSKCARNACSIFHRNGKNLGLTHCEQAQGSYEK